MAELLRSLQDSQLVARFQRRCGLFPGPDEGPQENSAGLAESVARAPGVGHHLAANDKGGGGPANGLRRVPAPQVIAGQVFVGVGERAARSASRGLAGPGDSATRRSASAEPARLRGRRPPPLLARWAEGRGPGGPSHQGAPL